MSLQINKVTSVTTIAVVAKALGESEDWLFDVAGEMEPEDGLIWVYGTDEDAVMAFTDFGIDRLKELIDLHRDARPRQP